MTSFRDSIERIVEENSESFDSDFEIDIDLGEQAVESLTIESQGDVLTVSQYANECDNIMRDPLIRADISQSIWVYIEYRNDYSDEHHVDKDGLEIDEFLRNWATNLQHHFL